MIWKVEAIYDEKTIVLSDSPSLLCKSAGRLKTLLVHPLPDGRLQTTHEHPEHLATWREAGKVSIPTIFSGLPEAMTDPALRTSTRDDFSLFIALSSLPDSFIPGTVCWESRDRPTPMMRECGTAHRTGFSLSESKSPAARQLA